MDLEGSYTKGSQSGRGRLWYMRYSSRKIKIDMQVNKFTTQKETAQEALVAPGTKYGYAKVLPPRELFL